MSYRLGMEMNVNELLLPRRDVGVDSCDIIVPDAFVLINAEEAISGFGGLFFRMIARSERTGRLHDVIVRQGVYKSKQDGMVKGTGNRMRKEGRRFGTWAYSPTGVPLNTGEGKGYRSWLYSNVILVVARDGIGVTSEGTRLLTEAIRRKG